MKIVRYRHEGREQYGALEGDRIEPIEGELDALRKTAHAKSIPRAGVSLLAPVAPSKIVATGRRRPTCWIRYASKFPPGVVITAIGEADQMAYAVDSLGRGWSWGWNGRGALCLGDHRIRETPTLVPGLSDLVAVAGGGGSVVWLTASGVVYTCGTQLTGTDVTPVRVKGLPAGDPAVAISAGNSYSTVRLASGHIGLGPGRLRPARQRGAQNSSTPVRVLLPSGTSATQVYSGGDLANDGHQLAVLNTGAVVAWGSNICGQLGAGHPGTQSAPVTVQVLQGMSVAMVAAGGSTSYVVDHSGNLWAWGADGGGQVRQPVRRCVGKPNKVDTSGRPGVGHGVGRGGLSRLTGFGTPPSRRVRASAAVMSGLIIIIDEAPPGGGG